MHIPNYNTIITTLSQRIFQPLQVMCFLNNIFAVLVSFEQGVSADYISQNDVTVLMFVWFMILTSHWGSLPIKTRDVEFDTSDASYSETCYKLIVQGQSSLCGRRRWLLRQFTVIVDLDDTSSTASDTKWNSFKRLHCLYSTSLDCFTFMWTCWFGSHLVQHYARKQHVTNAWGCLLTTRK